MRVIHEDFVKLDTHWNRHTVGTGRLEPTGHSLRLVNVNTTRRRVTNAQLDDYQGLPRRRYLWRPPLTMSVRACFSHPAANDGVDDFLRGTAGFGFWNDPFMMTGRSRPALPRAIWFFYASPPSDIKLDPDVPGWGWKAAMIDALRLPFFLLMPLAPLAILLMNIRPLYRRLWPVAQRAIGVRESPIEVDMTAWHTYTLEWGRHFARFTVDGAVVLQCACAPRGPLGFVMWFDNQYMVFKPWGRFRYGWLDAPGEQWMEVEELKIANWGDPVAP